MAVKSFIVQTPEGSNCSYKCQTRLKMATEKRFMASAAGGQRRIPCSGEEGQEGHPVPAHRTKPAPADPFSRCPCLNPFAREY